MFCLNIRTFAVAVLVLGLRASGVLALQITGPRSAQYHTNMTITWTSVSTDPKILKIRLINSPLNFIDATAPTADGSLTVNIIDFPTGEVRLTFFDEDNNIVAASVIDIVDAGSTVSANPSASVSGSASPGSASTTTSSSASQAPTGLNQTPAEGAKKHSQVGVIAGGVTGVMIASMLALLAWWYVRRRRTGAVQEELNTLAAPVLAARSLDEFRPWDESANATTAGSSAPAASFILSSVAEPVVNNPKQPIIMRWDPAQPAPPSESAPSREELEDEVRRLREHVSSLSPPSYSAHGHE
ncbi:hypothetical protein B0H14DRAFT_2874235 [Mycena olivaceomarginata]|nr:hypothetical protein B0H14DRAFT_2874235 [Mycena olivaceomarginata]